MQHILFSDIHEQKPGTSVEVYFKLETPALTGKRVVVVEDEGITQMQLNRMLTREGMDVVATARSGPEGVQVVRETHPDLVLMDIRMPGGFDGLEAARRILAQQSVCIVMLTAFSNAEYKEQARQIGACGYVVKPIDRETLLPQLEAALKSFTPQ